MAWLEDGTLFDSTLFGDPLVFSPGRHSVMRGVELLVIGMSVGESKTQRIPPELAFGSYRPELSIPVSRRWLERYDILPAVGMALEILKKDRTLVRMVVTELSRKHVTLDANHRLAGQSIVIQLDLLAIAGRAGAGDSGAWGNE
jgi:peptidylprolyl isomerase